ncbi:MAG: enoyl-CoA hydratase/isomerase family protein [Chloroflexi bacterium]|nr:enoyl-CoA hydratase/isomerase family protein [Chloroflexota bacterium]
MEYETIRFEKSEGVATITLNRPERLNAINIQMGYELVDALDNSEMDPEVRCVVLTGTGRGFCSGDDLRGMESPRFPARRGPDSLKDYVFAPYRWTVVVKAMRRMPKPVIGSIRGPAHGGGFNLAMGTDIRIASETANFATPFAKWAIGSGVNQLHYHVGLGIALEMAFTGDPIDAYRAERLGLVNKVVPDDQLESATRDLAQRLAKGPTRTFGTTKAAIYKGWWKELDAMFDYQAWAVGVTSTTEDIAEGRKAFVEKRAPNYKGR